MWNTDSRETGRELGGQNCMRDDTGFDYGGSKGDGEMMECGLFPESGTDRTFH